MADRLIETTDGELVRSSLNGDRQSFRALYRRHQQRVRQILYQLCDSPALDDLVRDVFLQAWKGLSKFPQDSQFSIWLYRITWNVAVDCHQTIAKDRSHLQTIVQSTPIQHQDPYMIQLHYQDLVRQGLSLLSQEHRSILVLHDLEELSQKDVAEILEIPVDTIKSRLLDARNNMRSFLEAAGVQL